ncbi:transducin-like enhancer protein 7 [Echinops telfairi]|uniref:Transducin-like enhancer protein 7 n=1 Tax=Echinops telfairi TaxID=9371 RepID=A0AC55DDN9_ECHTE|nr:transducin-like enhancer protein 7 [Echinops telfairi]
MGQPPVPEGAVVTQRLPYCAWKVGRLCHQRAVSAIAISCSTQHVYTCGTNYMKVWDNSALRAWNKAPVDHLRLEGNNNCIFTCKLLPDEQSLVTGGLLHGLNIWDLAPTPRLRTQLASEGSRCFSIAISSDGHILMACFSEFVEIWDLRNQILIRYDFCPIPLTPNPLSVVESSAILCFDMSSDNQYLITGSNDNATVYQQLF